MYTLWLLRDLEFFNKLSLMAKLIDFGSISAVWLSSLEFPTWQSQFFGQNLLIDRELSKKILITRELAKFPYCQKIPAIIVFFSSEYPSILITTFIYPCRITFLFMIIRDFIWFKQGCPINLYQIWVAFVCVFVCNTKCYRLTYPNISAKWSQIFTKTSPNGNICLPSWLKEGIKDAPTKI